MRRDGRPGRDVWMAWRRGEEGEAEGEGRGGGGGVRGVRVARTGQPVGRHTHRSNQGSAAQFPHGSCRAPARRAPCSSKAPALVAEVVVAVLILTELSSLAPRPAPGCAAPPEHHAAPHPDRARLLPRARRRPLTPTRSSGLYLLSPHCARPRRPLRLFASPRSSLHRSPRPRSSSARSPSPRSPSWGRPLPGLSCRLPLGSPGRTPGRPARGARAKASLRVRVQARAKAAFMKKFSSSASAWVTSRPNSTSTPIVPNNNNNNIYTKDVEAAASTPTSRGTAPAAQQQSSLPQSFAVKVLGWRESRGLWGVKHTRAPVDAMVATARALPAGQGLERATLEVSAEGVSVDGKLLPIDCISYGVQDLVYTRVFCCVLVSRPDAPGPPFKCHAFVCESRAQARALTYALAAAFQEYSRSVKQRQAAPAPAAPRVVDLRTPEDIAAEMLSHCQDSEA